MKQVIIMTFISKENIQFSILLYTTVNTYNKHMLVQIQLQSRSLRNQMTVEK